MVDGKAGVDKRVHEHRTAGGVAVALEGFGVVVVERGNHGGLDGTWNDETRVLAQLEQLSNEVIIAREEAGAVRGHIRGLGQRMHGNKPGVIAIGHARIEDGYRRVIVIPSQAHIALIGGDDGAGLARPRHDAAQLPHAKDAAGGIGRRI